MKKILSLVLVITTILMCSLTAFAAEPAMVINAVEDNDGIVTFTVNVTSDELKTMRVDLTLTNLEYINDSFSRATLSAGWNDTTTSLTNTRVKLAGGDLTNSYVANNTTVYTFKYKKTGEWSVVFSGTGASKKSYVSVGTTEYNNNTYGSYFTIVPKKASTSTDIVVADETFDDTNEGNLVEENVANKTVVVDNESIAMGESGKVYTFFKKNSTENDLQSLKYGLEVTIGGTKYKFPGQAPVPAGKAWAIKLVVPNGTFENSVSVGAMSDANVYFD